MANKNVLSIDIGSCKTKVVAGWLENQHFYIEKAFMLSTPEDCYSDGKLLFSAGKAEQLKQNLVQNLSEHRLKLKDVIITIQSTSIIRRELDIPPVKPQEMESMIRYEIEQYLPIDLSEYIIEYKMLNEKKDNKSRVLIAALPKAMAEEFYSFVLAMKLEPIALDINSNAISKLFGFSQQINHKAYELNKTAAFIDIGCSNTNISIVSKGQYQFSRTLLEGGMEINSAIADRFYISMQEAEKKKLTEGSLLGVYSGSEAEALSQVIESVITRWIDDIQRVFQFYKTRNANNNIDEIYLYGGTSNLKGIAEYFGKVMNIPTQQIKSLDCVRLSKQLDAGGLEYYLNSIGAMIRK